MCRGHRKEFEEGDRENVSLPNTVSIKVWVHWRVRLRRPELPEFRQLEIINILRKRKTQSCTVSLGNPQGLFPFWSPKDKGLGNPLLALHSLLVTGLSEALSSYKYPRVIGGSKVENETFL